MKTDLRIVSSILLVTVAFSAASQPEFVQQIPRASAHFTEAGQLVFFVSNDSLFRTDGTAAGTLFLAKGLKFEQPPRLLAFNDLFIFAVFDPNGSGSQIGRELWRSDGTITGTYRLLASDYSLKILDVVGSTLYLTANGELFKTDGTLGGTTLVKDIRPGDQGSFPIPLTAVGNELFFAADDGVHGRELWKTDGTSSGTVMIKDISPGMPSGVFASNATAFENRAYFSATTADAGNELWVSDGTSDGTFMVEDLVPGDSSSASIEFGLDKDGWLYFFSSTTLIDEPDFDQAETELWRTDGTSAGTEMIKSFSTRCAECKVNGYWVYNDRLFFFLQEGAESDVLYATDGTTMGTVPVFSLANDGHFIGELNGHLLFSDVGNYMHTALYRTDGTLSGTDLVRQLVATELRPKIDFVKIGDKVFFSDHDAPYDPSGGYSTENQLQLMQYDGVATQSVRSMGGGSYPGTLNLLEFDGQLIFTTEDIFPRETGDYKKRLWLFDPNQPFENRGTFTLVNADNDEDIQVLTGGEMIPKSAGLNFNIRFDPPDSVGSVVFKHQGKTVRRENEAPYAIGGDRSGNYMTWVAGITGQHKVEATPYSGSGGTGTPGVTMSITFTITDQPAECLATGTILLERWNNVRGAKVSDIPLTTGPSFVDELTVFETPQNIGINYATRVRGYICPPASGDYIFWIASNDHSELWLSTDDEDENRQRIAYVTGATDYRQWTKFKTQRSAPIHLEQGKRYYIEALHKQGVGTDHLSVGWQLPDGTLERPIQGNRLSPFDMEGDNDSYVIVPVSGDEIDPLVVFIKTKVVENATTYTVQISDEPDFSGEVIAVGSSEVGQNEFIVKNLKSATQYYTRVKTDVSGFGPLRTFTTRDPMNRHRLWGIAATGGDNDLGTIFSYSIDDNTFVKHYDQSVESDYEERLRGTLVPGPNGMFYGHRQGTYASQMFEMDSQGNVEWWNGSAYFNESQLFLASNADIYATTTDNWEPGIVDRYDVENGTLLLDWRKNFFTQFSDPNTLLIEPGDGYLYGAAGEGGVNDGGFLYKFRPDGSGFKIIYYFYDATTGMKPYAGLVEHGGFLYGTASQAGQFGHGTIFKIGLDGTSFAKLHDFNGANGSNPRGELIVAENILFGTTDGGGTSGHGTIFRIDPDGNNFGVLHNFEGEDGSDPSRGVVHDSNGNLYGMTSYGGDHDMGVIYKVGMDGTGFAKLFDFNPDSGGHPDGALIIREDTYQGFDFSASARVGYDAQIDVHPNPSAEEFTVLVKLPFQGPTHIVITDQFGYTISRYNVDNDTPVRFGADLKSGLYIMKIVRGNDIATYRLIKK